MNNLHPQYIKNINGQESFVVLPIGEFKALLEELEDYADIKSYDEAKQNDNGERIPMDIVFSMIEAKGVRK